MTHRTRTQRGSDVTLRAAVLLGVVLLLLAAPAALRAQPPILERGLLPGDLAVAPETQSQQDHSVARGGDRYLVVWSDYRGQAVGGGTNQSGGDIFGIRLDAAGNPIDPMPFLVAGGMGLQRYPLVAWNGSAWLVVYISQDQVGGYFEDRMRAVRVSSAGQVLDATPILFPPTQFTPNTIGRQVAGQNGQWLVTRCIYHDTGYGTMLVGQRIDGRRRAPRSDAASAHGLDLRRNGAPRCERGVPGRRAGLEHELGLQSSPRRPRRPADRGAVHRAEPDPRHERERALCRVGRRLREPGRLAHDARRHAPHAGRHDDRPELLAVHPVDARARRDQLVARVGSLRSAAHRAHQRRRHRARSERRRPPADPDRREHQHRLQPGAGAAARRRRARLLVRRAGGARLRHERLHAAGERRQRPRRGALRFHRHAQPAHAGLRRGPGRPDRRRLRERGGQR